MPEGLLGKWFGRFARERAGGWPFPALPFSLFYPGVRGFSHILRFFFCFFLRYMSWFGFVFIYLLSDVLIIMFTSVIHFHVCVHLYK